MLDIVSFIRCVFYQNVSEYNARTSILQSNLGHHRSQNSSNNEIVIKNNLLAQDAIY